MSDDPSLASFDWRRLRMDVRTAVAGSGQRYRQLAAAIGITPTDLSRLTGGGRNVSIEKVLAVCLHMRRDPYDYFIPAATCAPPASIESTCCRRANVKHPEELRS